MSFGGGGGATIIIGGDPLSSLTNPFAGNTNRFVWSLLDDDKASGETLGSRDTLCSSEMGGRDGRSKTWVVTSEVARDSPGRGGCDLGEREVCEEGEEEEEGGGLLAGETGLAEIKTIGFSFRVS